MPINILPFDPGNKRWGTYIGAGLSEGLNALTDFKVKEMLRRRENQEKEEQRKREHQEIAEAYKKVGIPEEFAPLDKAFGTAALKYKYGQEAARTKRYEDLSQAENKFKAYENQAVALGINPKFLKIAEDAGPETGTAMLKGIISDLQKPDKAQSFLQQIGFATPSGKSRYGTGETSKLDEIRQKYTGITPEQSTLEQIKRAINPSPEEKQAEQQRIYNAQVQQEMRQNPPKNGLDALNDYAAQQVVQQEEAPQEDPYAEYKQYINSPDVSLADKEALREEMFKEQGGRGYGPQNIPSILGNLASGAAQSIGTLGGATELANAAKAPLEKEIKTNIHDLEKFLETADKDTFQAKYAQDLLKQEKKRLERYPAAKEIKEEIVRPVAKALGLEDLIETKNWADKTAERVGSIAPLSLLSSVLSGGAAASNFLKQLGVSAAAEGVGQLTKERTGSEIADTGITLLGYLTSGYKPGAFKDIISKGYDTFESAMNKTKPGKISVEPVFNKLDDIKKAIKTDPKAPGNKFLADRIHAVESKVTTLPKYAAEKLGFKAGEELANAKHLYELDKQFGKVMQKAKTLNVGSEMQQMRKALRESYQPHFMKEIPAETKGLIDARKAKAALSAKDIIQEKLEDFGKIRVPILSQAGYVIKFLAGTGNKIYKYSKLFATQPILRKAAGDILDAAANNNPGKAIKSATDISKYLKKNHPEVDKDLQR